MTLQSPLPSYTKPWLPYRDQVALLQSRGMVIANPVAAAEFLRHVNYYRFSGYCLAFEQTRHLFRPNVTIDQVRAAYEFDRILRDLMTEALEVIEVDLRSAVVSRFGEQHGAFGHINPALFFSRFHHADWKDKLHDEARRSSELFVQHFRRNYCEFPDLPIWAATEIMSFGGLSQMYNGMLRPDQKTIATRYGLQPGDLASWMHHMVYVRNLCAHHSRLWDRVWAIKPVLPHAAACGRMATEVSARKQPALRQSLDSELPPAPMPEHGRVRRRLALPGGDVVGSAAKRPASTRAHGIDGELDGASIVEVNYTISEICKSLIV